MDSDDCTWRDESLGARTLTKTSMSSFGSWTGWTGTMFIEKLASRAQEPQGSFTGGNIPAGVSKCKPSLTLTNEQ